METNFTKGEWKTTIAELKDFFLCAVGSVETKRVICHTNLDPEITSEECKANAKLIAASPIMYDYIYKKSINGDEDAKLILATIE